MIFFFVVDDFDLFSRVTEVCVELRVESEKFCGTSHPLFWI